MKIIIFDLDGVLFDTIAMAEEYLLSNYPGLTVPMQKEILTGNFHEEFQKYKSSVDPKIETPEEKEARQAAYAILKLEASMYAGTKDLLHELHEKGYILTINTSALKRNCVPLLEKVGIDNLFDFVATTEISKSKVEKFKIISEKYGVSNENILFITDTLGDIREADTAQIPTVAVSWGAHNHSFFNREPHETLKGIVDSVDELRDFIYKNLA